MAGKKKSKIWGVLAEGGAVSRNRQHTAGSKQVMLRVPTDKYEALAKIAKRRDFMSVQGLVLALINEELRKSNE